MPWKKLIISLLIFIVVVSPWLAFNRVVLKIWSFSTLTNFSLYLKAVSFNEWLIENGKIAAGGPDILLNIKEEKFWSPEKANEYLNTSKDFIMKRPLEYAEFILLRSYRLFTGSGYENIAAGIRPGQSDAIIAFQNDVFRLNTNSAFSKLKTYPVLIIMPLGSLFFGFIGLMALFNLFIHTRKKTRETYYHAFFFITLVTYCLLVSPHGDARIRIPINPVLFLLALDSLIILALKKNLRVSL